MNKNTLLNLGVVAVAGVAFYLYKKKEDEKRAAESLAAANESPGNGNPANPNVRDRLIDAGVDLLKQEAGETLEHLRKEYGEF